MVGWIMSCSLLNERSYRHVSAKEVSVSVTRGLVKAGSALASSVLMNEGETGSMREGSRPVGTT